MIKHIVERNANTTRDVSPHFGGLETEGCANWKVEPAEVFRGPFNRTLANTIVIIGNTVSSVFVALDRIHVDVCSSPG